MFFRLKTTVGTHHLKLRGKRVTVRRGETIEANPEELASFLKNFEPLSPMPAPAVVTSRAALKIVPIGGGYYNVVNGVTGAKLNTKGMRKAEAEAFLEKGEELPQMPDPVTTEPDGAPAETPDPVTTPPEPPAPAEEAAETTEPTNEAAPAND